MRGLDITIGKELIWLLSKQGSDLESHIIKLRLAWKSVEEGITQPVIIAFSSGLWHPRWTPELLTGDGPNTQAHYRITSQQASIKSVFTRCIAKAFRLNQTCLFISEAIGMSIESQWFQWNFIVKHLEYPGVLHLLHLSLEWIDGLVETVLSLEQKRCLSQQPRWFGSRC